MGVRSGQLFRKSRVYWPASLRAFGRPSGARAMDILMKAGCHGIYHPAGPQPMSRLEMFETLFEEMNRAEPVDVTVVSCSIDDFPIEERRPRDVSIKSDKLVAETNMDSRDLRSACRHLVAAAEQATA
jgi:dTDP-4-dehydrorhamnose reductase